ncbi:Bifunctional protein, UDP-N-acetylglucosamine pyrophosphorylase (N-acetylglucosamine-1-phosphate uridyltransferase) Glucosamine-1-phosphate N-acetyltransferase [Paracholeplasma brassicae]|uniref:Bifunctional protein GlmU n=1 Tax=Acholeplasma brassicae TaxID=61635 RepID=U4KQR7_9MOLU|nr:bifunctional UDP-N-acetylglucosamine diphosphorylase/glucosamine-1-phosphate N-acetyltransferase GlmU [Paracholeplasma brassicae]CCV65053.1 Bifunctional protein, UDP-N-acetylglucosamine pyrophosphorylase (N-acetylglucosamine-1-phosphate uridyltransferase) Glucosamine-1-phosphate N-acetyltransferase [Paracholeplasma brassicae]
MKKYALILAAGKGTRMKTELPKCAFPILGKPMIEYIVENLEKSQIDEIVTVVGHKKEVITDLLKERSTYAIQEEQLGTGHATLQAASLLEDKEGVTFILPGDMPLMEYPLMDKIIRSHEEMGNDLTIVSMMFDNPKGYGRVVRDEYGVVTSIVEEIDCNDAQKQIKEVNSSVYVVNNQALFQTLKKVKKNDRKGEYYLTDIVELMHQTHKVNTFTVRDPRVTMGINDLYNISIAEKILRDHINKSHMLNGVSIINPETVTIGHDVIIEEGVWIYPNSTIVGDSIIKKYAKIGPNSEVRDSIIDEYAEIRHSLVIDSKVGKYTTVGPFAHLRGHTDIGEHNRIGNFVEVKNSTTGKDTKAAHLSYIGDAIVGNRVNFGCGSITVNYDGVNKHKTNIGDDVFIGCNVNMVAPLTVSDEVFIAAGSTVTKDIPKGSLSIARNQQINKEDYYKHLIKPKNDK